MDISCAGVLLIICQLLEAYMMNVPGFNSRGLKRREWQNGSTWHPRYWFRVPMFLTCETRGGQPDPPTGLHEWVVAAHKRSTNYRANPVRPLICGLEGGRLQSIGKCTPQRLEYGDVVSVVFSLIYVEDREDWGPVPMVTHIIRVQHANRDTYPLTATVIAPDVVVGNTGLRIGFVVDGESVSHGHVDSRLMNVAAEKAAEADAMKEKAAAEAAKAKAAAVHARAKLLADATVQAKAAADAARAGSVVDAANSAAPPDMAENAQLRTGTDSSPLVAADGAGPMSLDDKVDAIGTQSGHASSETDVVKASIPAQGAVTPGAVVQGKQVKDGHLSGSEMDVDDEEGRPVMSAGSSNSALTGEDDDDDGNSSEWTLTEDATAVTSDGEVPRGKRTRRGRGGSDDENVVPAKMGRGSKAGRGRRGGKTNK